MTQPFGLYRMLSLHVLDEVRQRGLLVNASACAGARPRWRIMPSKTD